MDDAHLVAGFRPVHAIRQDQGETILFNILGDQEPEKGYSVGGFRCRHPIGNVSTFFIARRNPQGTFLVRGIRYFLKDAYDVETNEKLTRAGVVAIAPTPPMSIAS